MTPAVTQGGRRDAVRNYHRILDAARDVLGESGAEAGMEEIAARAGVGIGTVYRRFASKDALIDELVRLVMEEVTAAADRALTRDDGHGLEEFLQVKAISPRTLTRPPLRSISRLGGEQPAECGDQFVVPTRGERGRGRQGERGVAFVPAFAAYSGGAVRDADRPQADGFYYWEFREQGGAGIVGVRKEQSEPFTVTLFTGIQPGDVTVYRGKA